MDEALISAIHELATPSTLPDGTVGRTIAVKAVHDVSKANDVPGHVVETTAMRNGVIPARYLRNMNSISALDQIALLESHVAQVGLGGLGGTLLEHFLRLGVGRIRAADGDHFEASNLNRQLLSSTETLDRPKSEAAVARKQLINPSVDLDARDSFLTEHSLLNFVSGVDVVVDALGGLETRLALQNAAAEAGIPMVTGALAGWTGYVGVVSPGSPGPADIMGNDNGAEEQLGCPSPSVSFFASIMATEVVKLLTGVSSTLTGSMLIVDLKTLSFDTVSL